MAPEDLTQDHSEKDDVQNKASFGTKKTFGIPIVCFYNAKQITDGRSTERIGIQPTTFMKWRRYGNGPVIDNGSASRRPAIGASAATYGSCSTLERSGNRKPLKLLPSRATLFIGAKGRSPPRSSRPNRLTRLSRISRGSSNTTALFITSTTRSATKVAASRSLRQNQLTLRSKLMKKFYAFFTLIAAICVLLPAARHTLAVDAAPEQPPGVVINKALISRGFTSVLQVSRSCPTGTYIASHDYFGRVDNLDLRTHVFESKDKGETWALIAKIPNQRASYLFYLNDALYADRMGARQRVHGRDKTRNAQLLSASRLTADTPGRFQTTQDRPSHRRNQRTERLLRPRARFDSQRTSLERGRKNRRLQLQLKAAMVHDPI